VLVTCKTLPAQVIEGKTLFVRAPVDRRADAQRFLSHWAPDFCLWTRGDLHHALLSEASKAGMPLYLIDAQETDLETAASAPWARLRLRGALRRFESIMAVDDLTAGRLLALGARPHTVSVTGALEEGATVLPHDEAERAYLAMPLATRPVWYGAGLPRLEFHIALDAQERAIMRAHRTLAVLAPADLETAVELEELVKAKGFRFSCRSRDDEVDPEDQVLISDVPEEEGLWYRLAPVTYLGGTLSSAPCRSPFEPAALGSAIIHGPRIASHHRQFSRLTDANAARLVAGPADLSPALTELVSPDRSARLAHAAWDVTSSGAGASERIVEMARSVLSARNAS